MWARRGRGVQQREKGRRVPKVKKVRRGKEGCAEMSSGSLAQKEQVRHSKWCSLRGKNRDKPTFSCQEKRKVRATDRCGDEVNVQLREQLRARGLTLRCKLNVPATCTVTEQNDCSFKITSIFSIKGTATISEKANWTFVLTLTVVLAKLISWLSQKG